MTQTSADEDFDDDLINDYREGFNDHYEIIVNCIATLETTPDSDETIDEMFRSMHTVKGNARILMFAQLAEFLHSIEESISAAREHKITFTALLGEAITLSLDKAKEISEKIFSHSVDDDPSIETISSVFLQMQTCKQNEVDPLCAIIIKEVTGFDIEATNINTELTIPEPIKGSQIIEPQFSTEMVQEMILYIDEKTPEHLKERLGYMRYLALLLETKIPHWQGRTFQLLKLSKVFNQAMDNPLENHQIEMAVYLHDMAFSFLPNSLMLKKEKFNTDELALMQTHTQIAADFIGINDEWKEARDIVLQHHERSDGGGYPNKLVDEQICIGAKMLSIVDAFMAMAAPRPDRPYKRSVLTALNEIKSNSGTQFSKDLVPVFIGILVKTLK